MHVFLVLVVCQVVLCQAQNQTTTSVPMNTTSPTTTSGLKTTIIPTTTSGLNTTIIPTTTSGLKTTIIPTTTSGLKTTIISTTTSGLKTTIIPTTTSGLKTTIISTTTSGLKTTIIPTTTSVPMTTIIPTTTPPPTTTTCKPTPPSVLTDGEGNKYQVVYGQGDNMKIYNGSNLVLSVVSSGGLIIEIPAGRGDVCIIRDMNAVGDCFDEVPYTGPLSNAAEMACRRKTVVRQIARKCENEAESTRAGRAIVANVFLMCCVWIRYPCYPICFYELHCGKYVCVRRIWRMCQVRFCISGWTGPFVLPGSG